eukprot:365622-Chlamydomonas_euryale.AAC.6
MPWRCAGTQPSPEDHPCSCPAGGSQRARAWHCVTRSVSPRYDLCGRVRNAGLLRAAFASCSDASCGGPPLAMMLAGRSRSFR